MAGNYSIGLNEERPLCGMFQRPRPKDRPAPTAVVRVQSPARVSKEHRKMPIKTRWPCSGGGSSKFPKRGEQAVFADPEGAVFGVMKSSSGDPPDFLGRARDWI